VSVLGREPVLSGRQEFSAMGLEYVLGRDGVESSWWAREGVARESFAAAQFNELGAGGRLRGNRSAVGPAGGGPPVFAHNSGVLWTALDILRYVLHWHLPAGAPSIRISGQTELLERMTPVMGLNGESVLGIVTALIDRRRGLNARLVWDGGDEAELRVATEASAPVAFADLTLEANPQVLDLDLAGGDLRESTVVRLSEENRYGRVVVRGQPLRTTFSASVREGTLAAGWLEESQQRYNGAGVSTPGYTELPEATQAALSDMTRQTNPFLRAVYTKFRLAPGFEWELPARDVEDPVLEFAAGTVLLERDIVELPRTVLLPRWTDDGLLDSETLQAVPERITRFARQTSLVRGWDYVADPPVFRGDPGEQGEVEPPMCWAFGPETVAGGNVVARYYDASQGGHEEWPTGNVAVSDDELAVYLQGQPIAHVFAGDDFQPGTNAQPSQFLSVADWRDHIFTVAVESDPVEMRAEVPGGIPGKTLVVHLDDCAVWWIAPGTVVAVEEVTGRLRRIWQERGVLTRDDRGWMRAVMALTLGWYGRRRAGLEVVMAGIGGTPEPQAMIRRVDAAIGRGIEVNSLVTRVVYDFERNATSMTADYAELDAAGLANRLRSRALGAGGGGASVVAGVSSTGGGVIGGRVENLPVRFAKSSGGFGGGGGGGTGDPVPLVVAMILPNGAWSHGVPDVDSATADESRGADRPRCDRAWFPVGW
jgi:hypothetical protein